MKNKSVQLDDDIYTYLLSVSLREPEVLRQLREETASHPHGGMQIAPEQGQFMALLVELIGARRVLEIGVFTGYSSTCMALALPPDGRLMALDLSVEYTETARRYWQLAGVADKIELRLAPALESLDRLIEDGASGNFDLAFIDADKGYYDAYYERSLRLLRPGGLLLIDNVLWGGKVADATVYDDDTQAIRALNQKIHADDRVTAVLLPVADGLTVARKRQIRD
ncbi:MAG: SAM-dependent methyltransferase [Methylococcus sp.]|nr:MAG: SAM-dependent methyltransferase [Methylococcus sp.]